MPITNPTILTKRAVTMQRISDLVNHGFSHFSSGSVSALRCQKLVNKFDMNYQVFLDRNQRARRKRAGLGSAHLVLWLNNDQVNWWLLVTNPENGEHAAHSAEKLKNALYPTNKIQIDGFELVTLPKPANKSNQNQAENKENIKDNKKSTAHCKKTTRLTWRMNQHKYEDWRASIIDGVRRSNPTALHTLIYQLFSSPGFGGIRIQIGKLAALYKAEVKRAARKTAPELPKKLYYVRRLKHDGISLLQLIAQL